MFKLQAREQTNSKHCQRLLTVGFWAGGGVLEVLERRIRPEGLRKVLRALRTDAVALKTADEG